MNLLLAEDGKTYINRDHIVTIEVVEHKTGTPPDPTVPWAGTWQVRARTSIGWGTGGYSHTHGHLVVLRDWVSEEDAARFVKLVADGAV